MSYTVDLIIGELPQSDAEAWQAIEVLRARYYGDKAEKSPVLIALHQKLTDRYPCLCSYADDDPRMEQCPWADGPMIDNFASEMGMLAVIFSRADEVVPFIIKSAIELGITVADGQSLKIYRPRSAHTHERGKKPWWKQW
jgi:hypothetical protein